MRASSHIERVTPEGMAPERAQGWIEETKLELLTRAVSIQMQTAAHCERPLGYVQLRIEVNLLTGTAEGVAAGAVVKGGCAEQPHQSSE